MLDITDLIQLRAHCPTFNIDFVAHTVAEHIYPEPELCGACEERIMLSYDGDDEDQEDIDDLELELLR